MYYTLTWLDPAESLPSQADRRIAGEWVKCQYRLKPREEGGYVSLGCEQFSY